MSFYNVSIGADELAKLKADLLKATRTIALMVSAARHPDAKIGCLHVVRIGRSAMDELEAMP